jgi:hypothetical protein
MRVLAQRKRKHNGIITMTERELEILSQIKEEIKEIKQELKDLAKDQEQSQKWQDKTWDVLKWVGGISAGLSISAAIALVGIVLRFSIGQ